MAYYDVQVAPNSAFVPPPRPASAPPPLCQNCGQFNPNSGQPHPTHAGGYHAGCIMTYPYAPVQAAPYSGFISPPPLAGQASVSPPPNNPGRGGRGGGRGRSFGGRGSRSRGGRGQDRGGSSRRFRKSNLPQQGDWLCESCGDVAYASRTACRCCGSPKPADAVLIGPDGRFPEGTEVPAAAAAAGMADAHDGTGNTEVNEIDGGEGCGTGGQYQHHNYGRWREGDWVCPNPECGDTVFSYRNYCRCCGSPKPPPHQIVALGQGGCGGETEVRPGGEL